jgi:hypothetical protein
MPSAFTAGNKSGNFGRWQFQALVLLNDAAPLITTANCAGLQFAVPKFFPDFA